MQTKYLNEFFGFRAAGDMLNAAGPVNQGAKEITEAMAIRKRLREVVLREPMKLNVIDVCSGNALVPILSAFTLPSKGSIAIDKKKRKRNWHLARRFEYREMDIYSQEMIDLAREKAPCVITACHACGNLAKRAIQIFREAEAESLVLIPCCVGKFDQEYPVYLKKALGNYDLWAYHLSELAKGQIVKDTQIISPRNMVITAQKD